MADVQRRHDLQAKLKDDAHGLVLIVVCNVAGVLAGVVASLVAIALGR